MFSLSVARESERHCYASHVTFTKSKRTIYYKNIVIHTATHATPEDPLICGDGLMNDKAKICNHRKFYNHYYESFFESSWSGSISVFSPFYSQTPIMLNL